MGTISPHSSITPPPVRLTASGNTSDVTAALVDQLTRPSDVTRLRTLVLLDCLLQAGRADGGASLAAAVGSAGGQGDGGATLAAAVGSLATEGDGRVRAKAEKVGRIMERLAA